MTRKLITLCGSSRFEAWFHTWNLALGLGGQAPIGMCSFPSDKTRKLIEPEDKQILDEVHKFKIERSDAVLFLNVLGYMGESTLSEYAYAKKLGKPIYMLESWGEGCGITGSHCRLPRGACKYYKVPYNASPVDVSNDRYAFDLITYSPAEESFVRRAKVVRMVRDLHIKALMHEWTEGLCIKGEESFGGRRYCFKSETHSDRCVFE